MTATHATPGPRPQLRVRSFGEASVLVDGRPAAWHAQSAEDLFYYLLSHPEGRTREEVLNDLWDLEADPSSSNRFRVTLHRLRAALGRPDAITEQGGRYQLSPDVFQSSDVRDLYTAMHEAERAPSPADRKLAYQRAISTYSGDYLPQQQAEWALAAREEHRAAYVRACVELSLTHCDGLDCRGAITTLTRALRADPYIGENYHQKLMTCLSVVEGKYAAIEHYRRFLKFLRDDLNDTPMPQTSELADRIKCDERICTRLDPAPALTRSCPLTPDGSCPGPLGELLQLTVDGAARQD